MGSEMKELIADIDNWLAKDGPGIVIATVIETWGSAPRKVGSKMAFTAGGAAITGSVSGGCVEGAVIAAGDEVLATGRPQLLRFGVADDTAWGVGLACGGTIEVFVECLDVGIYAAVREWVVAGAPGTVITIVRGPAELLGRKLVIDEVGVTTGTLGGGIDEPAIRLAARSYSASRVQLTEEIELFIDVIHPPPTIIIVGGAHIAVALAGLAKIIGYQTVVIDPRRAFGTEARFPHVDKLIHAWPDKAFDEHAIEPDSALITLSHDPKIDDPALRAALDSKAFYIGALGSRKTNDKRIERLLVEGFTEAQLSRIHAPVGLDIGANNPEEIALAIMAEVVAAHRGKLANPLIDK